MGSLVPLLLAALVLSAGCVDYAPLRDLQALPEANLAPYPSASLTSETTTPERPGIDGATWADQSRWYCVDATKDEVIAYYDTLLGHLGWHPLYYPGLWEKDGYQLKIIDYSDLVADLGPGCTFKFRERLSAKPR